MKKTLLTLLFGLIALSIPMDAYAQSVGLSISPPLLDVVIKPSKSILIAYTIENKGDPVIVRTQIRGFVPKGINGGLQLKSTVNSPARFNLDNNDISLNAPFLLKSREKKQLLLKIRIPEGVLDGDYYQALTLETDQGAQFQGVTSLKNKVTIASPILLTITESGRSDQQGDIALFQTVGGMTLPIFGKSFTFVESNSPLPVRLVIGNTGANRINPKGIIEIESMVGEKYEYGILPDNVLSNSQRLLQATPSAVLNCDKKGNSTACKDAYTLVDTHMHIGKTTIRASLNFGPGTDLRYGSFSVIALPIKFIVSTSVIIVVLIVVYRSTRKTPSTDHSSV